MDESLKRRLELLLLLVAALEFAACIAIGWRSIIRPAAPVDALTHVHPWDPDKDRLSTVLESVTIRAEREDSYDAWLELARLYLTVGYYPEAAASCRYALALRETFEASYVLGVCLDILGRTAEAVDQFRHAHAQVDPTRGADPSRDHRCWWFIGRNYMREERPDKAIEAWIEGSYWPPTMAMLAYTLLRRGRMEEALAAIEFLKESRPNAYEVFDLSARYWSRLGDPERAAQQRAMADGKQLGFFWHPIRREILKFRTQSLDVK